MRFVFLVVLTYFALAAQVACGELLNVAGNRMPLLWLPVVWALTWFEDTRGIVWAVLVGLLADGLSDGRFGQNTLAVALTVAFSLPLLPEPRSRTALPMFVWTFALIASIELLAKFHASLLSDGAAVSLMSLIAVSITAGIGAFTMSLLNSFARLAVQQSCFDR